MCGICGIVTGTISDHEASLFKKLLYMCAFRGMDSTGIFAVQGDRTTLETPFVKDIGDPMSFLALYGDEVDKDLHTKDAKALVGHTRHATRGTVNKENSHPFDFPNVIGVHNGTLWTSPKVAGKEAETDSESLYAFMNKNGLDATLSEMSASADAYTLVFYDKKKKTLNAIRNDKRPLSFVPVNGGSTIYWASEAGMLRWVLDRESVKYDEVYTIHPGYLLAFDMTEYNPALHYDIVKMKIKPKPYTPPVHTHSHWGGDARKAWEGQETPPFIARDNSNSANSTGRSTGTIPTSGNSTGTINLKDVQDGLKDWEAELARADDTLIPLQYDPVTNKLVPNAELSKTGIVKGPVTNVVSIDSHKIKSANTHHHRGGFFWIGSRGFTRPEFEKKLEKGCAWCSTQSEPTEKVDWLNLEDYLCESCIPNPEVQEYRGLYAATSGR